MQHIAIIGAGQSGGAGPAISGTQLARRCAEAGFLTVLEDIQRSRLRHASAELAASAASSDLPNLRYSTSIEDAVRTADLVMDTVPDELESKLEILSLLDRMAPPATLFATPTSHLSIADLGSCTYRPMQCFGLRFAAAGSSALALVEITHVPGCAPSTLEELRTFFQSLGLAVEVTPDLQPLP
ncbi:3-hydroxyacyl-CoA dehydrogenase [Acidipila sp. EB88]|nr:3-hydroxyacyl-CoA dehydrogenase [Acidipila sp. EB88]